MSEHTPGPWQQVGPPVNGRWLVRCGRYGIEVPFEADARLIAAAPDLLAALKLARQYVGATHAAVAGAVGNDNLISPDLATVDAAITKAEGTS